LYPQVFYHLNTFHAKLGIPDGVLILFIVQEITSAIEISFKVLPIEYAGAYTSVFLLGLSSFAVSLLSH
jgi:hypothetical protein